MSLARVFDQANLRPVTQREYLDVRDRIESNYFLSLTRDSRYMADSAVDIRHAESGEILMVAHYEPKPMEGTGLNRVHKVDKDLWSAHEQMKAQKNWP